MAPPIVLPAWGAPSRLTTPGVGAPLSMRGVPGWFRIGVPNGWQFNGNRASGRIGLTSTDRRGLQLWLLLVPRVVDQPEAMALFSVLATEVSPRAQWSEPNIRHDGVRTTVARSGREGDTTLAAGLSMVRADRVTIAFFTMAYAPSATFVQSRDVFAAVLESFTPLPGNGGTPGAGDLAFERWSDPIEKAFSVEVPKGWKVQGGTVRRAAIDLRQVVQVTNPEQSVLIQAGDAEIPPFVEPWGLLQEGQHSGPALALRYQPGQLFGRTYLDWRVRPAMRDLTIDDARPVPQLQQALQTIQNGYAVPGIDRRIDVGELFFRGTWNGHRAKGYLFAATSRVSQQGGGAMWFAGDLGSLQGFIAAEDRIPTAVAVMDRIRNSFEINPQWFRDNARTVEAVSRMTAEANKYVSDIITRSYAATQKTYGSIFDRYSQYQRDVVTIKDPRTAQSYQVQTGGNYYWIDDRGNVVGSNTHFNPGPLWFREMLIVRP